MSQIWITLYLGQKHSLVKAVVINRESVLSVFFVHLFVLFPISVA